MDTSFGSFNRWILAIVLIFASLQHSDAQNNWPPGVQEPANPTIVVEGVNSSKVSLVWGSPAKDGDTVVSVLIERGRPDSSEPRISIALRTGPDAFELQLDTLDYTALLPVTLEVKNVDNTKEYDYFVTFTYKPAGGRSKVVKSQVRIVVHVPPRITREPIRNSRVNAGQNLTLTCNASGDPIPNITWSREGATTNQLVNATGYKLTLVNVQRKDVGSYKCTADNGYGIAFSLAIVNLICSQCNTTEVGITIREGAQWRDSLQNRESLEFKMLASNLTSAIVVVYSQPGNQGKQLHELAIKEFRPGSVIAVVQMQFPRGISDPLQPLRSEISDGSLGILFKVDRELELNPTIAPPTTPTGSTTPKLQEPSDSGARSGLSPEAMWGIIGACIAFVLIVTVVILVCCFCRKKKSIGGASKGKKYTEADGYRMNRQPPPSGLGTASPAYVEARMYAPANAAKKQDDQPNQPKYADLSFDQSSKPPPRYGTDTEYTDVSPSKRPPPPAGGGGGQGEGGFELWC